MIVSLSHEVCLQVQEVDRLQRLKSNLDSLQATFEALSRLRELAVQLRALVLLHKGRLPEHVTDKIESDMEQQARAVQACAEKLAGQPRQVKEVTQIKKKTQDLIDTLKDQWKLYAEEASRETLELLRLVNYLPEVKNQQEIYQKLKARLQHFVKQIPLTPIELAEFDGCLQQLNQHLSNIEGLSADVRRFLAHVLAGQATLRDLTDEVLQWCRQGARAQTFVIGFSREKRG